MTRGRHSSVAEASRTAHANAGAEAAQQEEVFDIHVDTQYAATNCNERTDDAALAFRDRFAREPWECCRDAPNTYLSLRVGKRAQFLEKLGEKDRAKRARVQHEIDRITQTRVNFSSYANKTKLMEDLRNSREAWKDEVVRKRSEYEKKTRKKAAQQPQNERWQRDLKLLDRLRAWPESEAESDPPPPPVNIEELYGFRAGAVYFKKHTDSGGANAAWKGFKYPHEKYKGDFPNQKIPVHDLLDKVEDNPLREPCDPDVIRWFHFPTNNMHWVEKAMARHYREEPTELDDHKPRHKMSKAEKVLSREFWRGQMHGTGGRGYAGATKESEPGAQKGKVTRKAPEPSVRGPLHARHMRSRCSIIPRDSSEVPDPEESPAVPPDNETWNGKSRMGKNLALFAPYMHWETSSRRAKMVEVVNNVIGKKPSTSKKFAQIVQRKANKSRRSLLGEYLINLSKVADEMDYEADERLLRDNLTKDPPLHIRRTLDQYYFLTLEDTSARDRDQVVYRGTRAGRSFHTRNTRVVMVDQLWLWILDDNTIITSFPRRWGRNKPDPSGVHKSLRERLEHTKDEGIKSIHHLALLIIDQCSRVFFDRTKPLDERPEVMDLFSSAIGHLTELTSIAYESFWRNTALHSWDMLPMTADKKNHKYLDINPEGILLQEAQDIAEELAIMLRIYNEQRSVVKEFRRYLGHLNGEFRHEQSDNALIYRLLDALEDKNGHGGRSRSRHGGGPSRDPLLEDTIYEAEILLEQFNNRQAEIQDLEDSAMRTCRQLEGLLSLKQQQASIVEAKAALRRADESVKQGRAIMAFTIVTIFFLPLGFFAAFFGMNNVEINQSPWMTLHEQVNYMFGLSAAVILLSVSLAFSSWTRALLRILVRVPLVLIGEYSGVHAAWKRHKLDHVSLERRSQLALEHVFKRREQKKLAVMAQNSDGAAGEEETDDRRSTSWRSEPGENRNEKDITETKSVRGVGDTDDSTSAAHSERLHRIWNPFHKRNIGTRPRNGMV